jgi:hypothetical protein
MTYLLGVNRLRGHRGDPENSNPYCRPPTYGREKMQKEASPHAGQQYLPENSDKQSAKNRVL